MPACAKNDLGLKFPRLSRGINLHHLLNWPEVDGDGTRISYRWPPFSGPSYQLADSELALIRSIGFDFLRITADPGILIMASGERFEFLVAYVKRLLDRLFAAGFNVVLDLHPVAVNPDFAPLRLVEDRRAERFQSYCRMVRRLAAALSTLPAEKFALELMNEPWLSTQPQQARWPQMLEELHACAREAAPNLPLVLTGPDWSSAAALTYLDPSPYRNSNVLYTFHYYDPHAYTHQGVEGDENELVAGLHWPASVENAQEALQGALARAEERPGFGLRQKRDVKKSLNDFIAASHDMARMRDAFAAVAAWSDAHFIPRERIFLGEFGCVSESHGVMIPNRLAWLTAVRKIAETFQFPWAFWAYKGYGRMALVEQGRIDWPTVEALGLRHDE